MEEKIIAIRGLIETAERFRNAYFWTPPCSASSRRWYEEKNTVPLITWEEGGHAYTAEYIVSCSCRNVYARGEYTRDGEKTTLTAIRNSLKRMENSSERV